MKSFTIIILCFLGFKLSAQTDNIRLENAEILFNENKFYADSILKTMNYKVHEKDINLGITTYKKITGPFEYYVWLTYNKGKLKYLMWDEHYYVAKVFIRDIRDSDYNLVESKSNDYLGVVYYTSISKNLDLKVNIHEPELRIILSLTNNK